MLENELYPYTFTFKVTTFHNDFEVKDVTGEVRAYVKQKLLKLKEHVKVYSDTSQQQLIYEIKADRWLDFNASYRFLQADGTSIGRIVRKGWRSLWKVAYDLYDHLDQPDLSIHEKNPWVRVGDALFSEIPILGILTGYVFNPTYLVTRPDGTLVCTFKKRPSFFGRKFELYKEADFEEGEENRVQLGLMMMVLLERRRG
ncbi:MAG: hypothetical protein JNM95_05535 [Chitinophagaceae bacterium]|nr:hypothetical protein [Chitinophagaceae bacterium]